MHYAEYFSSIEGSITSTIRDCYPISWVEDHITLSIIEQVVKRNKLVVLDGLNRPFKIQWDARKLRIPAETLYGDVAVLVRLTTWAGETVEGVGLLEAKRRDLDTNAFSAIKLKQLDRIRSSAPSARLMLYDYEQVMSCMDNWSVQFEDHFYRRNFGIDQPYTHCVCLPISTAIMQGKFTTALHKFGLPLSYQLIGRYFRGFDLEQDPKIVRAVKKNALKHGGPRTIILVGISTSGANPIMPEVDDGLYGPID